VKNYIPIIILIMLLVLLGLANPVGASDLFQVTETLTATPSPAPTVTPTPTIDFANDNCPAGGVIGLGTYTPSPLWFLECEQCLTPWGWTPEPTATTTPLIQPTHDGTGTPVATWTPEATLTPSVTPTPTAAAPGPVPYDDRMYFTNAVNMTCLQVDWSHVSCTIDYMSPPDGDTGSVKLNGKGANDYTPVIITYDIDIDWTADPPCGSYGTRFSFWDGFNYEFSGVGHVDLEHTLPLAYWGASISFGEISNYCTDIHYMTGTLEIYLQGYQPAPEPTPTPAPTPLPSAGYCGSISNDQDTGFGFDLFVPDGVMNCGGGWDEITILDKTIPAVEICFQPSQFGVIELFGNDFEVGTIALVAAAAWIWRNLRTV